MMAQTHSDSRSPASQDRNTQSWLVVLVLFSITSIVEAIGVSQIFAFMPLYLQNMGLPQSEVARWVGILSSLVFLLGLPLVPLWGVWADKYSRKAIIIRSALVEAVVFFLVAISRQPWQLAASFLLAGFQLGNTGVMLSTIRDVTPKGRLGTAMAMFGATSSIGFALGPTIGGVLIDGLAMPVSLVYASSAVLSLGVAALLGFGLKEVRPMVAISGRLLELAFGAIKGTLTDPTTRRLFTIFGIAFLARQMSGPYLPILVQEANHGEAGLASAVALVVGTAALIGGLISPIAGTLGDRMGFRPVLATSLAGAGLTFILMPFTADVSSLAMVSIVSAALFSGASAMIFGLLAVEVPSDRRSATLNLVYLPLYLAGIIGPSIGAAIVTAGVPTVFYLSGIVLAGGAVFVIRQNRRRAEAPK